MIKISPCARLECWVDPLSMQAPKALDTIGAKCDMWRGLSMVKLGGSKRWVRGHAGTQGAGHAAAVHQLLKPLSLSLSPSTGKNLQAQYERYSFSFKLPMISTPKTLCLLMQARTCRRSTSGGSRGPSTRCTWTPPLRT